MKSLPACAMGEVFETVRRLGRFGSFTRVVVGERVAVVAVELALRGDHLLIAMGLHPFAVEADGAVLEAERADVAVGVQGGVVGEFRRIEELATDAHERAIQIRGNLADHLAIGDIGFETHGGEETDLRGVSCVTGHVCPLGDQGRFNRRWDGGAQFDVGSLVSLSRSPQSPGGWERSLPVRPEPPGD